MTLTAAHRKVSGVRAVMASVLAYFDRKNAGQCGPSGTPELRRECHGDDPRVVTAPQK